MTGDQGFAPLRIVLQGEHVLAHAAVVAVAAVDLLPTRPRGLSLRTLSPRETRVLLQLVGAVEVGRVRGGIEARAYAEAVDGCIGREEVAHDVLVEAA